jgi:hypothetical protein
MCFPRKQSCACLGNMSGDYLGVAWAVANRMDNVLLRCRYVDVRSWDLPCCIVVDLMGYKWISSISQRSFLQGKSRDRASACQKKLKRLNEEEKKEKKARKRGGRREKGKPEKKKGKRSSRINAQPRALAGDHDGNSRWRVALLKSGSAVCDCATQGVRSLASTKYGLRNKGPLQKPTKPGGCRVSRCYEGFRF